MNTKHLLIALAVGGVACSPVPTNFTTGGTDTPAQPGMAYRWSFDEAAGAMPDDMLNVLGTWTRDADPSSPSSPNVLRQSQTFAAPNYPRVLVKDLTFSDLTLHTRCRVESGGTDQACGLIFRAADSDNYYITRANALEGNVRLYRVIDGDRQQFAGQSVRVERNVWHTLEVTAHGDQIVVRFNGAGVISAQDRTFTGGHIGLWTKADSVTSFDDLEAVDETVR